MWSLLLNLDNLNSPINNEARIHIGNLVIDMLKQLANLSFFFFGAIRCNGSIDIG